MASLGLAIDLTSDPRCCASDSPASIEHHHDYVMKGLSTAPLGLAINLTFSSRHGAPNGPASIEPRRGYLLRGW